MAHSASGEFGPIAGANRLTRRRKCVAVYGMSDESVPRIFTCFFSIQHYNVLII
jgi:hypothetical protein